VSGKIAMASLVRGLGKVWVHLICDQLIIEWDTAIYTYLVQSRINTF
jgi:hypothetical protein